MKYTHASSPAELNLAPLFPLPTEAFQAQLDMFSHFTERELDLIAHMNLSSRPPATAVDHLLQLREQPIAASVELFGQELGAPPTVDTRVYRAGVCLAVAIFRQHAQNRGTTDIWPTPTSNRTYLRVPEWLDVDRAHLYSRLGLETKPERTNFYLDTMSTERYVEDGQALSTAVVAMGDSWERHSESILGAEHKRYTSAPDLFGRVCGGFADAIRLRYMLEYEQRVAPVQDTVYDPSRHFLIEGSHDLLTQFAPIDNQADGFLKITNWPHMRFPAEGVRARYLFDESDPETSPIGWGNMSLTPDCVIQSMHRAIFGIVLNQERNNRPMLVGFRKSLETFTPEPDDVVVTAGLGFGTLEHPFVTDDVSQVAAISEHGAASFLSGSKRFFSDPELGVYDSGFLQALRKGLLATADPYQRSLVQYCMPLR